MATMTRKLVVLNESSTERFLRVVLGLFLISLVFFGPATNWGWIGLIPLVTGLWGYCPVYAIFGFTTRPLRKTFR